jgi:hypothetical protein
MIQECLMLCHARMIHPVSSFMMGWISPSSSSATDATVSSSDSASTTASLSAASVAEALSASSPSSSSSASPRKITADVQSDLRQMFYWLSSAAVLLADVQSEAEKSPSNLPHAVNLPNTTTVRGQASFKYHIGIQLMCSNSSVQCSHISDQNMRFFFRVVFSSNAAHLS